ncbi:hypothetical protein AVEN_91597-1 [Araneus ventricosus]|uniref:Uncharacterized protein n=1 Tax=Araneus ventricosus TaxID=182803 RepID=A0A4Y2NPN9_ARAVE|nr:hypothetical protein AVEN_91597-1 [Araneus ventricosus]
MLCRFPASLVLWLGREFYRGKFGMTGLGQAWTPDLGDKSKIPENEIIFSISLLGPEIRISQEFPCTVTPCHYNYTAVGFDGERLWNANDFGDSSAVRAGKLVS